MSAAVTRDWAAWSRNVWVQSYHSASLFESWKATPKLLAKRWTALASIWLRTRCNSSSVGGSRVKRASSSYTGLDLLRGVRGDGDALERKQPGVEAAREL